MIIITDYITTADPDQSSEPYMYVTSANSEVTSELRITYQVSIYNGFTK